MIKLITSDMDGSLLDNQKRIPKNFFPMLKRLNKKGIKFVAASGRSYPKMEQDFRQGLEDMYFICDNGAITLYQGKVLHQDSIDRKGLAEIIQACEEIPEIMLVLCGVKGAWHKPCPKRFQPYLTSYYIREQVIEDLTQAEDDILKIAICDLNNSAQNSYPVLNNQFGDRYSMAVSGAVWMDIMNRGVNKGKALARIQHELGVARSETMAFGDFYNDIELLQRAEYSYVMDNANEDMKQHGNYIAPSNEENGVIVTIEERIFRR